MQTSSPSNVIIPILNDVCLSLVEQRVHSKLPSLEDVRVYTRVVPLQRRDKFLQPIQQSKIPSNRSEYNDFEKRTAFERSLSEHELRWTREKFYKPKL